MTRVRLDKVQRSHARLESLGAGRFLVGGVLDASTVTQILAESRGHFRDVPRIAVDLSSVTESDSSGLALLLEWLRVTRKAGQHIQFDRIPEQITALARISEVDNLLLESAPFAEPGNSVASA